MVKEKTKIDPVKSLKIIFDFNGEDGMKIVSYSEDLKYITVLLRKTRWFLPSEYVAWKIDRTKNKIIEFEYSKV